MKAQRLETESSAHPGANLSLEHRKQTQQRAAQDYLAINQEHWIALPMERGAKIKLEDGSIWQIAPAYQAQTMIWLVSEKMVVMENPANPSFPYSLINSSRRVTVEARLISPPN